MTTCPVPWSTMRRCTHCCRNSGRGKRVDEQKRGMAALACCRAFPHVFSHVCEMRCAASFKIYVVRICHQPFPIPPFPALPVTPPVIAASAPVPGVTVENRRRILRLIENLTMGRNAVGYLTESLHGAGSSRLAPASCIVDVGIRIIYPTPSALVITCAYTGYIL